METLAKGHTKHHYDMETLAKGLITKTTLRPGHSPSADRPVFGNEVTIHYVGRLVDGTVFESTRERNRPFTFRLGDGEVVKGTGLVFPLSLSFERS